MDSLRSHGHEIVYDWTVSYSDNDTPEKAIIERDAIKTADLLVLLWHPDAESARYEAGMAMGLGKQIIVSEGPDSFFFHLPGIISVSTDDDIIGAIRA